MTVFRSSPTYDTVLVDSSGNTNKSFYRWIQDTDIGTPPSTEIPVKVSASPFVYQPPKKGYVLVSGGSVSVIEFSRTPGIFYITGMTTGMFSVNANDSLRVTYSSMPLVVLIPS
jgi:hypothetical protein